MYMRAMAGTLLRPHREKEKKVVVGNGMREVEPGSSIVIVSDGEVRGSDGAVSAAAKHAQ